jgi:hypothetical protein
MVTEKPRAWRSLAMEAEMIPLPNDDVTPPVTKMYFADMPEPCVRGIKIQIRNGLAEKFYKN